MSDYNLDQLDRQDGLVEALPVLDLNLDDKYIIKSLHELIENSASYYDNVAEGFNLKNKRLKNAQMLEGKHLQEHKLYRHQTPYIDNEIFVGIESIIAYVTAQSPKSEVYPAKDTQEDRINAKHLEIYHHAHSQKFELPRKLEGAVYNMLGKYIGLIKLRWDPLYGENGEIVPEVVDPNHVIIDKTAKLGENPRFICHVLKCTIEELIAKFPEKEEEILSLYSIKRRGSKNMSGEVIYREVWFTYYDDNNEPQEAVAWYTLNLVLDKRKNPNWLYDAEGENFLDMPIKPFIPFNLTNDGSNWIDKTSPLEQAVAQQDILNKMGRQLVDNLATANGFKVLDAHAMRSEDAQNFTGDPNQLLLVKTKPGQRVQDVVAQLPPQIVSQQVMQQLVDSRNSIHNILGTPSQFRGDDQDQDKTASEAQMIKNQASGRQDKIVRAIDYAMDRYFKLLTQMMTVYYTERHYATVNGGDGNFDFIEMHKDKISKGMTVKVQSGTTLPFDKARQESVAQNAAELGMLAPYDYFKLMHMDEPQKLYDNLVKWKSNPEGLAMDLATDDADQDAIIDFTELMAGKKPKDRDNPTPEYIEQLRKKMVSDEFLKAKKSVQDRLIKFVQRANNSLAMRTAIELSAHQNTPDVNPMTPPQPQQPGQPTVPQASPQPEASPIQSILQGQPPQGTAPNLNPSQPQVNATNVGQLPPI